MPWQPLSLSLRWPPYFRPDPEEQKALSEQTATDYDAGLITLETAVERIASMYGIENVPEYVKRLAEEKSERLGGMHKALAELNATTDENGAGRGAVSESGDNGGNARGGVRDAAGAQDSDNASPAAAKRRKRRGARGRSGGGAAGGGPASGSGRQTRGKAGRP